MESSDYFLLGRNIKKASTSGFEYLYFLNPPKDSLIKEDTLIGSRVLCASKPDYYHLYLIKYHVKGDKCYPYGGVEVYNANEDIYQSFYMESSVLHPSKEVIEVHKNHYNKIEFVGIPKLVHTRSEYDLKINKDKKIIKKQLLKIKKSKVAESKKLKEKPLKKPKTIKEPKLPAKKIKKVIDFKNKKGKNVKNENTKVKRSRR